MTTTQRFERPPVVLTFLAPADRCNQRCPACIIDRVGEPVRQARLTPEDYARIVEQFVEAGVPILSLSFQGYEVTLPKSWPYLEAAFDVARRHHIRRSFITNGMLLDRWVDRIRALDPQRITISLDGADPETHDPLRGLPGAFSATLASLRRFVSAAPEFRERIAICSTLYNDENVRSLVRMPRLLRSLGLARWCLGFELLVKNGREVPAQSVRVLSAWVHQLSEAAGREGTRFFVNDEFGLLKGTGEPEGRLLEARGVFDPRFLVRVEPAGFVRVGDELLGSFDERHARVLDPRKHHILDVIGYEENVRRAIEKRVPTESTSRLVV